MTRRSSIPIVGALVVSVLGAGVTRSLVIGQRQKLDAERGVAASSGTNVGNLNSFALGLLLGGLRGPLVMALWTSSENQKSDKNLEDFDTKVELIRLLQPEFDTVHLFQIWNKAYNVSVQMANVPNKYTTILDALQYAFNVDKERPDDINILTAIGGLYFDKFGGSAEKAYFSSRMASETMPVQDHVRVTFPSAKRADVLRQARLAGATAYLLTTYDADGLGDRSYLNLTKSIADVLKSHTTDRAVEFTDQPASVAERTSNDIRSAQHAVVLDDALDIRPALVKPRGDRPAAYNGGDGSLLPYALEFEPYPYGVSPYLLAYNYYKRAQWLQVNRGARHAQLSDRVVSSRVPMALEMCSQEEWYGADRCEIDLAGREIPTDDALLQGVTADLQPASDLPQCPLFDQAIWRFNRGSRIAARAAGEYEDHLRTYPDDELTYRSHIEDMTARSNMLAGDALFLQVMRATGPERAKLANAAVDFYTKASQLYTRYLFHYYMDDDEAKKVLPQDLRQLKRSDVDGVNSRLRDDELPASLARMKKMHDAAGYNLSNSVDFKEIDTYVDRCYARSYAMANVR